MPVTTLTAVKISTLMPTSVQTIMFRLCYKELNILMFYQPKEHVQ